MSFLDTLDKGLAHLENAVIVALTSAALALGVMQVVLRYVFDMGFPWSSELFVMSTIWAMFFGGSRAVRDGVHVRVDLAATILPPRIARIVDLACMLISLALIVFFFYCGLRYVTFVGQMGIKGVETGIPDAVTFGIVPVAMAAFALRYVILIVRAAREARDDALSRRAKRTDAAG